MKNRAMTMANKIRVIITVTAVMSVGFFFMKNVPVARIIMVIVWVFHLIYFFVRVKTIPKDKSK